MAKLMLVEDDNNLREIYQARLQAEGYDIVAAKDGEEALVVAKAQQPDLIISDVMMPKISGFEMLDILRNTDGMKDVKVIMLTALGQSDDQARADKLGADRYLVKSQVTLEDIVKTAHDLLQDGSTEPVAQPATTAPAPEPAVTPAPVASAPAPAPAPVVAAAPDPAPAAASAPTPDEPPVVPEPVAAPAAEPVLASTPEPAAAPAPTAAPVAASTPQSTAQETASVEARIEDFVVGATSVPTTPLPTPTLAAPEVPAPAPVAQPATAAPVAPAPTATTPTPPAVDLAATPSPAAAADDKLLSDAVDTFIANTTPAPTPTPSVAAPTVPTPEPAAAPTATPPTPADQTAAPAPANDAVTVAGKKIITPLSGPPKQSINDLLALEEAKEAAAAPPPPPTAVIANNSGAQAMPLATSPISNEDQPSGGSIAPTTPSPAAPAIVVDPNSIAL